jgi:hypothetical protein
MFVQRYPASVVYQALGATFVTADAAYAYRDEH